MVIDWEYGLTPKKFLGSLQVKLTKEVLDEHFKDMDEAGIDRVVFSGGGGTLEECRSLNDKIAMWVNKNPERFIGLAHTIPTGGEEALEELDRAVKDLGFKGCRIPSSIDSGTEGDSKDIVLLNSPDLYPFYRKVTELNVPLFVHPASLLFPNAFPDPVGRRLKAVPNMIKGCGFEIELIVATKLIVDGRVLEKFPDLKVVVSHLGGGISAIFERLWGEVGREHGIGEAAEKSVEYFGKIYFNTAGIHADIDAIKFALAKISPRKIVFATDYPFLNPKQIKRFIQDINSLDISDKDKQLILEGNAASLLRV